MYRSLSNALICYIRYFPIIASNTFEYIWLIPAGDTQSWETPSPLFTPTLSNWADQRGLCIVVCITYGIDVFLLVCIGAWYRLAKYIMIHTSEGGAREGLFFLDIA